jgi:hypothetical protein
MPNFHEAEFIIESIPNIVFRGYTDGDTWNGWACPYFIREEAERVLTLSEANGFAWHYDTEQDAFICRNTSDPVEYEPEVFQTIQAKLDGDGELPLYGVGSYSWIWELAPEA